MWIAMLAAVAAVHPCQVVDGDQILMSDLAQGDARFAAAPAAQTAGLAPQPGAKRVFWPGELIHLAERNGIVTSEPFQQMCFEMRTGLIALEDITAAIRTWAPEPAHIEILERSQFPAPVGKLVLEKPQASQEARDGSMLLRGYILYRGTQRFPIWTRVRVRVKQPVLVSTADLKAGTEVTAEDLRSEEREVGIAAGGFAVSPADLVGRLAKTRIPEGAPLLLAQFEKGNDVIGGATVQVEVQEGLAHLSFEARAQTNGRTGDVVAVTNPVNNKIFKAKIVGKNSVLVIPGMISK